MIKKLKITESQYARLITLIAETPFDKMAKDSIKVGDVVVITWKGSMNKFEVVDNFNGQIVMDNIDKGSTNINYRYFIVFTSLNGDDLELRRVHKIKEKDKLDGDKSTWSPVTVKDISNIQVIRDGKVIDTVDPVSPTAEKQQKQGGKKTGVVSKELSDEINNDLAIIMEQVDENKGLKIIFNQGEILFCCLNKSDGSFVFEINKEKNSTLPDLNSWDSFILELKGDPKDETVNLYELNKDVVTSTDNGETFNLKFKVSSGEKKQEIVIKGIKGVSPLPSCESSAEEGEEKENKDKKPEELKADAQKALDMILKDPKLKAAFYSQPTFWQAFVAELKGKKAPGKGIIPTLDLLNKYSFNKITEKIGKGFILGKQAIFQPLDDIEVKYRDDNDIIRTYTIPAKEDTITVRRHVLDDPYQVLQKKSNTVNLIIRILVKEKTEDENVKNCDVEIGFKNKSEKFITKGEVEDVKIKFIKSEGYQPESEKK